MKKVNYLLPPLLASYLPLLSNLNYLLASIRLHHVWPNHCLFDVPTLLAPTPQENTQEVTLIRSANGLGFSFLMCELDPPTRDFGSLVRIKELFPGQPAEQSGRIQEGDVLLAINGQSLKELSYPVCAEWGLFIIYAINNLLMSLEDITYFHPPLNYGLLYCYMITCNYLRID